MDSTKEREKLLVLASICLEVIEVLVVEKKRKQKSRLSGGVALARVFAKVGPLLILLYQPLLGILLESKEEGGGYGEQSLRVAGR
jgi:hypothetical protein